MEVEACITTFNCSTFIEQIKPVVVSEKKIMRI